MQPFWASFLVAQCKMAICVWDQLAGEAVRLGVLRAETSLSVASFRRAKARCGGNGMISRVIGRGDRSSTKPCGLMRANS